MLSQIELEKPIKLGGDWRSCLLSLLFVYWADWIENILLC